jgi:secreted trypsin-like serine protease
MAAALSLNACAPQTDSTEDAYSGSQVLMDQARYKVVNGEREELSGLRSTVALMEPNGSYFCTGTLIHPRAVLTAAHCLENTSSDQVEIGYQTLSGLDVPSSKRRQVQEVVSHSGYSWQGQSEHNSGVGEFNDIALLILSEAIDQEVTPVLPADSVQGALQDRANLTVSGFGINDLSSFADGELFSGQVPLIYLGQKEILAGDAGNQTDTCNGDSGGPVYVTVQGQRYLVGVTSRAANTSQIQCGDQGIYTLASSYHTWINGKFNEFGLSDSEEGTGGPEGGAEAGTEGGPETEIEEGGEDNQGGTSTEDFCAENGWYGDNICDLGCLLPDPDCDNTETPVEPPATEDFCADNGWYGDNICDLGCLLPDPDCDNTETPVEPPATEDFCADNGWYGDDICDLGCLLPDPDCNDTENPVEPPATEDFCADNGWYGDDICDQVCPLPDPDCDDTENPVEPPATEDFCADNGWYGDAICDQVCPLPDPDCDDTENPVEPPATEDFCAENGWYGDDICDEDCPQEDIDCL